jgi:membrane protein implicated in regulation of membrane protease activity
VKEEPQDIKNQKVASWLLGACLLIIILMPFHGFISTWLGSSFGYLLLFKAWKELLLVPIVVACIYLLSSDKSLRRYLFSKDKKNLIILIGVFIIWQFLSAINGGQNAKAVALGLAIQVRWGLFFICCLIATYIIGVSHNLIFKSWF